MVSGTLALLKYAVTYMDLRQDSGRNRGQSPVEWGDFPYVHLFVRAFVRAPFWVIQPGLRPSKPGLTPSQPGLNPSQ